MSTSDNEFPCFGSRPPAACSGSLTQIRQPPLSSVGYEHAQFRVLAQSDPQAVGMLVVLLLGQSS